MTVNPSARGRVSRDGFVESEDITAQTLRSRELQSPEADKDMTERFLFTAQEIADKVSESGPDKKCSAKTITRYADGGWLKHRRMTDGTRLFAEAAVPRVLELRAARVPAIRRA